MGFFKDINTLKKQAKEIDKTWDPGAQMRAGKERMAAAQGMLAQQTAAISLSTTGETAEAQIVASRDTGTQINLQPVLELDLLVMRQGNRRTPRRSARWWQMPSSAWCPRIHRFGAHRPRESGDRPPQVRAPARRDLTDEPNGRAPRRAFVRRHEPTRGR